MPTNVLPKVSLAAAAALAALAAVVAAAPHPAHAQVEGPEIRCGEPIDGDESTLVDRAKEHFQRARALYDDGQYELAIPEYTASYCLLPTSSAAFNIANAYLFLVDYERGLQWLQLYVRMAGPDEANERLVAANRIDRIRKLPARVSVSTQPPYARVTLTDDEGTTITGRADDKEPLRAPAGAYKLSVTMDGFEAVSQNIELRIGQPYTFSFRLNERKGAVRIMTSPTNARILVDDTAVGVGTYVAELPIGRHKVSVEAEGRKPKTEELVVDGEGTATLFVGLDAPPQSGRWELITGMTLLGAGSGALLGNTVFEQGSRGATLITVGAGAVAFAGGYFGVRESVPVGHTSWIIGGSFWGAVEGIGIAGAFSESDNVIGSAALGGLIVGALASSVTVKRFDPSAGDSAFINSGGLWGSVAGIMLWSLFREEGEGEEGDGTGGGIEDGFAGFVLAGLNTGLLAGASLAYRYEYSRGHIALIDVSGLAGAVTGVALSGPFRDSTGVGDSDTPVHFAFGGMLLGLVTGAILTRDLDVEKLPAAVTRAVPSFEMVRTMAGETVPTLRWSGSW